MSGIFWDGMKLWESGDRDGAIKYFKEKSESGDLDSMRVLGRLLEIQEKYPESLDAYLNAAERGDAKAQFSVGHRFEMEGDFEGAKRWFEKARHNDLKLALLRLALLEERFGNFDSAQSLMKELADFNPDYLYDLGRMQVRLGYLNEAIETLAASAQRGNSSAMYLLSLHYADENNHDLSAIWAKRAADAGFVEDQDHP